MVFLNDFSRLYRGIYIPGQLAGCLSPCTYALAHITTVRNPLHAHMQDWCSRWYDFCQATQTFCHVPEPDTAFHIHGVLANWPSAVAGQGADTLMMHMGLHILNGLPGSTQLYQLIVPGLEERARFFPAIRTRGQLNAG